MRFILLILALNGIVRADEREIEGKVVVVTGAAQGIGYAIADHFLTNCAGFVIILDKNHTKGMEEKLQDKHGRNKVSFVECDVTTDLAIWDQLIEDYQRIDVLVNNAVVIDVDNPRNTITTNTIAYIEWAMKFLEHARKDKGGHGGTIMNVASIVAHWVAPFFPAYIASKYGNVGFSKSLGHEYNYKCTGVRVVAVCPSFTVTPLAYKQIVSDEQVEVFDNYRSKKRWQSADDVGRRAIEVFRDADTGTSWDIYGGDPAFESPAMEYIMISDEDDTNEGTCDISHGCE